MTLTYEVTLTIDGQGTVDVGEMLDRLEVTSGSMDGWQQPDPSSCYLSFLGSPTIGTLAQSPSWWLGRNIAVTVTPSDGTEKPVFYGRVYSVNSTPVDSTGQVLQIELGLQSPMADLGQYLVTSDQPAQTETVRLNALLDDARDVSWLEVGANITWDEVSGTTTWAQYTSDMPDFGWDLSTIHDLVAYTADNSSIDDVLTHMAMGTGSFFGDYLYMTAGAVEYLLWYTFAGNYADAASLTVDLETSAIFQELQTNLSLSNIYNYVEATNGVETRSFSVPSSIENYSLRKLEIETPFELVNDIDTLVANKATGRSEPIQSLSQVTIDYDLVTDARRIPYIGKNVIVDLTNVPANFGSDQTYIVRGMQLSVSYRHAEATWKIVPKSALAYFTAWWLLNRTDTWNTYATATTKWQDLT